MNYEFNEVPVSKKKSNKLRNLLIAIVLFISILAVKELAAQNFAEQDFQQFKKFEKPPVALGSNFSYNKINTSTFVSPALGNDDEIISGENVIQDTGNTQFFSSENFLVKNNPEQNFSNQELSNATEQSSPNNNSTILDIGILSLSYAEGNLTAKLKNYAGLQLEDELCLNVSAKAKSAFMCSNISILPFEEKPFIFSFPFSEAGIYNSFLFLNRLDDNSQNDNFSLRTKQGTIHVLAIDNITLTPDSENPLKIDIKVRIINNGDFNESQLSLFASINNETRNYGPYNYPIINSKTFHYSRTFNQSSGILAIFRIANYSNFAEDADEENNIKSSSIHVG